ncbi:MAG: hypothetical protein HY908_34025, partial [Myxococcales bacterium]|nr:hypothetical protein [Myxococcales bacterium]
MLSPGRASGACATIQVTRAGRSAPPEPKRMSAEAYVVCTSCGRKLAARFEACVYCGGPVAAPNARAAPASLPPPGPWKGRA